MTDRKPAARRGRLAGLAGLLAGVLLLSPCPASAAVGCSVDATPLAFGAFNTLERDAPHDTNSTVTVNCSSDVGGETATYQIKLSEGGANSFFPRAMSSGAAHLLYNIYDQPSMTGVWGDGMSSTDVVAGSLSLTAPSTTYSQSYPAYGRVFANQQSLPIGAYQDFVTVTVSY